MYFHSYLQELSYDNREIKGSAILPIYKAIPVVAITLRIVDIFKAREFSTMLNIVPIFTVAQRKVDRSSSKVAIYEYSHISTVK